MKRFSAIVIFVFLGLIGFSQDSVQDRTTGTIHKLSTQKKKKAPFKFVKNFFKYSTIYASGRVGQPLQETSKDWYVDQGSNLTDVTEVYPYDYTVSVGIRKIARFDYEIKPNVFYDGSEVNVGSKSNVGAVEGFEYIFAHDWVRQWGDQYRNQTYFLRYLGKYWVGAIKFNEIGVADLRYSQADLRSRFAIGKFFNITAGVVGRTHRPYGYNPIADYLQYNPWWSLAYEYGYTDNFYGIDYDNDDEIDNFDWTWNDPDGNKVADTDLDFRNNIYGDIVNDYNGTMLDSVGTMYTLSAAVGLDFYYYSDNERFWCHMWGNLLPFHKHIAGDRDFSYSNFIGQNQWLDYNAGVIVGAKLGKGFGLFVEGEYLKYWDRRVYSGKVGINYQLK